MCVCSRKSFIILCPCSIRLSKTFHRFFSEMVKIKEAFLGEKIIIVIFLKRKLQQFPLVFKESEFQFLMFYPLAIPR